MNGATANGLNSNGQILGREKRRKTDLPMLASACPGWVCYAEKTHGDYALPYISTVKSPQVQFTVLNMTKSLHQIWYPNI